MLNAVSTNNLVVIMKLLGLVFVFLAVSAKHEKYAGYKSYYVGPKTQAELKALNSIIQKLEVDTIGYPSVGGEGVILVAPELQARFTKDLEDIGVSYRIHVADIVKALKYDDKIIEEAERENLARNGGARIPFQNYQPLSVYDAYLDDIANRFPNLAKLVIPANSFEGRPIKYLKISTTNFEDTSKPIIFIEGGIHAREWIAPPTIAWAIKNLVEDGTEPDLLDKFDWILLPISNPDGYEYSYVVDRFWRKTRSNESHPTCVGVDGNRNYDFEWNTVGTSQNPCADTYGGLHAFSEIETRVVRDIIHDNLSRIAMYITMHSFGSMILYSWGHNGTLSDNSDALQMVGDEMADAINAIRKPHFPKYQVGNIVSVLGYAASGGSEDYAHSVGVDLAYTYELPGLNSGLEGFVLSPRYIEQVCLETWEGIVAGARSLKSSASVPATSLITLLLASFLRYFVK